MLRLSGARSLAMSIVSLGLGWWISLEDVSTLTHYKALSHDALMSELASKYDGRLSTNIAGGVFLVLVVVIGVDLLTVLFERLRARFGGSHGVAGGGSGPAA